MDRGTPPPTLIYGGTVLTLDDAGTVLEGGEVLLRDGRIAAVGRHLTAAPGTEIVDAEGCFVLPGLIQGHVHLGQTFFRGLAEGRRLLPWLRQRIWPLEAAHDDDSAYCCTLLGAAECLLSGTTTVQDIGIGPGVGGLMAALADSRLRAIAGKCLMDGGDGLPERLKEDADRTLAEAEALGDRLAAGGRVRYALNPRFVLSCSDALWRGVRELAEKRGWPIHTHALEQREETDAVRRAKGRDEIDYFDELGVLDADLRIAHGVWLEPAHLERLRRRRFAVVHCPSSNLKLGSGVADVVGLKRASIPVGLGCDGTACSNHLDAFEELRLAALLQKLKHGPEAFSGRDALALATRDGARALGLGDEIGSLEIGKQADVVVLAGHGADLWAAPPVDPHDLVAFSASRAHVREVFVGGERLVSDGALVHLDLAQIRRRAERAMAALLKRSGLDL
ncbi:MAG: N-ethylammeline chlorohydrolase [Acidobacteria bacterium]|nr:MAG: N-ethylammeline chlorohydrolase [Acidobacteriota bacterium]